MGKFGSGDIGLFMIGGYDVLGYITKTDFEFNNRTVETTAFGDAVVENFTFNLTDLSLKLEGWYDDTAGGIDGAMVAVENGYPVVCFSPEPNLNTSKFYGFTGPCQYTANRLPEVGGVHKISMDFQSAGEGFGGRINQPLDTIANATPDTPIAGSVVNNLASSANGAVGFLQVKSFSGATSLTVRLQHSVDGSTYANLITFTNVTPAGTPTALAASVTGTVNQYTRVIYTFNTPTAQTAVIMVGLCRK